MFEKVFQQKKFTISFGLSGASLESIVYFNLKIVVQSGTDTVLAKKVRTVSVPRAVSVPFLK